MSQTHTIGAFVNKSMKIILCSPLHRVLSQTLLLITFTGRKSGKTYATPLGCLLLPYNGKEKAAQGKAW
jgi:hypothetical protein